MNPRLPAASSAGDVMGGGFEAALRGVGLTPVLQPIVDLLDETTVGFEALARWQSLDNVDPLQVFSYAASVGRLDELDRLCIDAAIRTARSRRLPRGTMLAVNSEPMSAYVGRDHDSDLFRASDEFSLMFELTERSLLTHPHDLLAKVAAIRADGFKVALDDLGVHPDSLALLDVLSPDAIKLDLDLVQSRPRRDQARIVAAVLAHQERAGAIIIAEGIENDFHLEQALALGAKFGQGRKYACPGPLSETPIWELPTTLRPTRLGFRSPFDALASAAPLRTARKDILTALSQHIEEQAGYTVDPPMVLAALQHAANLTPRTKQRYVELAKISPLVAIFGEGLPADLGPGIRGVPLEATDPLCDEWIVVVLGPQLAAALIARESDERPGDPQSDGDRRFAFTITYNRSLVTGIAQILLDRML